LINSRIWEKGTRQWGELTVCFNGELRWHTFGTSSFPFWQTGAMLVVVTTTHTSISPSAVDSFALVLEFLCRNSQEKSMQIRRAWRVGITTEFLGFPHFYMVSGFLLPVFLLHNLYIIRSRRKWMVPPSFHVQWPSVATWNNLLAIIWPNNLTYAFL
jgi:hypothetical protein